MDDVRQPTPELPQPADTRPELSDLAAFIAWQSEHPPEDYYRIFMDVAPPDGPAEHPHPSPSKAARHWSSADADALRDWTDQIDRHGMPDDDYRRV